MKVTRNLLNTCCSQRFDLDYSSGADGEANDCLFVSHQSGKDSPLCGSSVNPCQTLPQAFLKVNEGEKICLDGRNSDTHPYNCHPMNSSGEVKMDLINKSIIIQGWFSKAHISCKLNGLAFKHARNHALNLTLSHLVFHNNGVILRNVGCSNVVVNSCRFMRCRKAVVIKQEESRMCRNSTLAITDTEFMYNRISILVNLLNNYLTIKISRCTFQGKGRRLQTRFSEIDSTGNVYINSTAFKNKNHVTAIITDSIFRDLAHDNNGFALSFTMDDPYSTGNLKLLNCKFLNNGNALSVYGGFDLQLIEVTINSSYLYAVVAGGPPKRSPRVVGIKVSLDQCTLGNNRFGIEMAFVSCLSSSSCLPSSQSLVVKNSLFLGGNETQGPAEALRFRVMASRLLLRPSFIEAKMFLENVTFQGLRGRAVYGLVQKSVNGLISVKNCKFRKNSEFFSQLDDRAIVQIEFPDEDPPKCPKQQWNKGKEFAQSKTTQIPVIFEDSIFENNVGISAALNFLNGNLTFKNCAFKNNKGLTLGGHVYMKPGYGSLTIVNSTFLQTVSNDAISNSKQRRLSGNGCFLLSESTGPIIVKNSSFTANISRRFSPILAATKTRWFNADATSILRCPSGRQVKPEKKEKTEGFAFTKGSSTCSMKVNYVGVFCAECPDKFYSLQRGLATGLDIDKTTKGNLCLKCPYGASCENGNIKAKENFWGLKIPTNPPSLKFFPCPLEYCSNPKHSKHSIYNGCHGSRAGVLCGNCSDGYSEVLYSTSCRKKENCNDHWFWFSTVIYVVVYAVYFVFKPPIFSVLYRQIFWFKRAPLGFHLQSLQHKEDNEHDSGYLKIAFYFYQVVELVMIKSPERALRVVPFIPAVVGFFNFQVKTLDGAIGCPLPGLSVVTKELFLCSKFLVTLLSIGVIYAIHRAASKTRYISQPSLTLYLAVALETLLLGYERLADTSFKLVHCVPIGNDWRLFVDGNIQCWQWWQYLMIAFIMVFIIPLILVLFWGSLMLAKDKVSAKNFLIACAFPLPYLLVWISRRLNKTENDSMLFTGHVQNTEEIKRILHDPFREPSEGEHGTLYWESVLTGRRLILLTIHTFATDPKLRFICLNCACVVILVHHLAVRPFRNCLANGFESFSLISLVAICTFSLAEASYISEGIDPTRPGESLFHALQWIEIGLLGLVPAAVCIFVFFAVLSQIFRLLYQVVRLLLYAMRCKCFFRDRSMNRLSITQQLLLNWGFKELNSVPGNHNTTVF